MNKKSIIYKKERLDKNLNNYDILEFDFADDLFQLQQDMMKHDYYLDIFSVSDFWSYYSDAYCAGFLVYTKDTFNEEMIEESKHPVYMNLPDIEIKDISDNEANKIKEDANKLYEIYLKVKETGDASREEEFGYLEFAKKLL